MKKTLENSQIDEFIANLKVWKAYELKKAIKLGFANFEDYIAGKISNQFSDTPNVCKAPKQRVWRKNNTKTKPVTTYGCCWQKQTASCYQAQ